VLLRDAGASSMPVVADLHQHRHQHVAEQVEGTEDGRQARDLPVDRGGVVLLQRRAEGGGIKRCRSHRIDGRDSGRASRHGEAEQVRVREPGEAPDAVSLLDRLPQQPQARDIGVRVHPPALVADGGHGVMPALPRAQRVDADAGEPGDGADRVVRGGLAHRTTKRTAVAHAADATTPHAASANASTNGHCRSVE